MVGMVGPGGGVCWALTALETSSNHLSASEGVRLCPLCICTAAETGGGEWSEVSGCTQEGAAVGKTIENSCYNNYKHASSEHELQYFQ